MFRGPGSLPCNNTDQEVGKRSHLENTLCCSELRSPPGCPPSPLLRRGLPVFAHPYLQAHALRLEQELKSALPHKSRFAAWSYVFNSAVELWDSRWVGRRGGWGGSRKPPCRSFCGLAFAFGVLSRYFIPQHSICESLDGSCRGWGYPGKGCRLYHIV